MQLKTVADEPDQEGFAQASASADGGVTARSRTSGGLFRNYVFDAAHVQLWVWLVTGLAIFALPGIGIVIAIILLYSCVHKTDAAGEPITPPGHRKSGARLLLSVFVWTIIGLLAIGFVIGLLLAALS